MAEQQQPNKKSYRGNCHCGAFVYEIDLPEIKTVNECNCSICTKKGYMWLFPGGLDSLKVIKGAKEDLTNYTFAKGNLHHKFCPHCGTAVYAWYPNGPQDYDGAALGDRYEPPAYSGPQPEPIDGGKIYTGNCHCGAVQVAVSSKPIDSTYSERIAECNCSICERNAYLWVYPRREHVVIHGDENDIGRYFFKDPALLSKSFCKKCGVQLTNEPSLQSEEAVAAMSDDVKKVYEFLKSWHPVNLRVLDGVDLAALADKIQKLPGADRPPKYQNP
ncbi:hypothetical protein ACJ41O_005652 [Fusarium nematophilum]